MALPSNNLKLRFMWQYIGAMTVALPMLMLGMATAWPSPTLPKIKENNAPLSLDHSEISWVVSLMFFGNTLSPLPVGQLMDKIGRKWTLL
ncbi:uncharacterized protein LOC128998278 isoform X2 [Macrosteles quadrilineatus]|uniref:uncharacterized protein LOC128998278 isoform X2 n=1 Tax=Macrosteles quadrilineatus TaxID=74068 RepID=UPI0023E0C932|nr:uncharacterized protein LOC128998278 isoform X2 [Macrosteles quadrilineatus]